MGRSACSGFSLAGGPRELGLPWRCRAPHGAQGRVAVLGQAHKPELRHQGHAYSKGSESLPAFPTPFPAVQSQTINLRGMKINSLNGESFES